MAGTSSGDVVSRGSDFDTAPANGTWDKARAVILLRDLHGSFTMIAMMSNT